MVVNCIDFDDITQECKCGTQFPAFEAILNGFNNSPLHDNCDKFNRINFYPTSNNLYFQYPIPNNEWLVD